MRLLTGKIQTYELKRCLGASLEVEITTCEVKVFRRQLRGENDNSDPQWRSVAKDKTVTETQHQSREL